MTRIMCVFLWLQFLLAPLAAQELYTAPQKGTETRWASPENPTGAKGNGGRTNHGAKGNAFFIVKPGAQQVLLDVKGAGVIRRMWLSGTIPRNEEQRRLVKIEMFWDNATKAAVDAPIGDFFGVGLGLLAPFESALFASPEARSYNFTIPMPFRTAAKIVITNESSSHALVWYDINYTTVVRHPADVMYFHTYWSRALQTDLGKDFEILPKVVGTGRYLGTNVGVIGHPDYQGTWFGEGEVKVYLDGDKALPTLAGTGTEDYIGTGWGQGQYFGRYHGSLISDNVNDLYAFYRYHLPDPVYFHQDCRVTLQQIGNAPTARVREMLARGVELKPVWVLDTKGDHDVMRLQQTPEQVLLLDHADLPLLNDPQHPTGSTNFYRRDDVSATAYFYLNKPTSNLPALGNANLCTQNMQSRVWDRVAKKP